jgi:hypothetical protein
MIGMTPGTLLLGLFALALIAAAMVWVIYLFLGAIPSSKFTRPTTIKEDADYPVPRLVVVPSGKENRVFLAVLIGVSWFVLWILLSRFLINSPGDKFGRYLLTEAFFYAGILVLGTAIASACGVWLWKRLKR